MERILFKKVEVWVLLLVILLCVIAALAFGTLVRQEAIGSVKLGRISKAALFLAEIPVYITKALAGDSVDFRDLSDEQRFEGRSGFNFYNPDPGRQNPTRHLLLSRYDLELRRSVVELIDLGSQSVVHTWMPDIDAINGQVSKSDEFEFLDRDHNQNRYRMVHPLLLQDGSLVFHDNSPLVKIDACSNLVFQNTTDKFHHAIETDADGNFWTSTTIYPPTIDEFGEGFYDDAITKISPDGEVLYQRSVTAILLENNLRHELYTFDKFVADLIHLNDIQPVNRDGPYWKKGDVFMSIGHLNMVALFRPETEKLIWWTQENLNHQHDIDILNDHEISIFDNNRIMARNGDRIEGNNEILVYDFATQRMRPILGPSLKEQDVRTISQGLSEILPNGDVFIEETNYGRLLMFRSDGRLKWEYVNRASDGMVYILNWSRIVSGDDASRVKESLAKADCGVRS